VVRLDFDRFAQHHVGQDDDVEDRGDVGGERDQREQVEPHRRHPYLAAVERHDEFETLFRCRFGSDVEQVELVEEVIKGKVERDKVEQRHEIKRRHREKEKQHDENVFERREQNPRNGAVMLQRQVAVVAPVYLFDDVGGQESDDDQRDEHGEDKGDEPADGKDDEAYQPGGNGVFHQKAQDGRTALDGRDVMLRLRHPVYGVLLLLLDLKRALFEGVDACVCDAEEKRVHQQDGAQEGDQGKLQHPFGEEIPDADRPECFVHMCSLIREMMPGKLLSGICPSCR